MDSPHVRTRPWKTGWGGSWPLMMILACTCLGKYRFFLCTHGCASALCIYGAGHKLSFTHYTTKGQWSGCRWRSFYIAHILTHTLLTLFYTNLKKVDCIRNKWKKKYTFAIPEVLCVHNKQWVLLHRRVQSDQWVWYALFLQLHPGLDHPDGVHQRVSNKSWERNKRCKMTQCDTQLCVAEKDQKHVN